MWMLSELSQRKGTFIGQTRGKFTKPVGTDGLVRGCRGSVDLHVILTMQSLRELSRKMRCLVVGKSMEISHRKIHQHQKCI